MLTIVIILYPPTSLTFFKKLHIDGWFYLTTDCQDFIECLDGTHLLASQREGVHIWNNIPTLAYTLILCPPQEPDFVALIPD